MASENISEKTYLLKQQNQHNDGKFELDKRVEK